MKHIKQYENLKNEIKYKVGDIVICIDEENVDNLNLNEKYKITKIYQLIPSFVEYDVYIQDYHNRSSYVDVISILNGESIMGVNAKRFINELTNDLNKYNL